MKKFIIYALLSLFITQTAFATSAFDIKWGTDLMSNMRSNTLKQWAESMESRAGGSVGTGDHYYVDSGVVTEGDGTSWADARDTLDEAVALCTEDNDDVIHVRAGHTEDWTAADSADLDVAGITVIGEGQGESRPTFYFDGVAAELVMGDASIMISNLRFIASIDSVVHIIEVEGDADGFIIYNCEFMEPESANTTDEADDIIQVAAGANQGYIVGNKFYSLSAGANTAIDLTAGVIEDLTIAYNTIIGDWTEAGIYSDDVDLRMRIISNTVQNTQAGDHAIWLSGAVTGFSEGNHIITDTVAASYDPGSLQTSNTDVWSDSDTTDKVAVPIFTSEMGVDWAERTAVVTGTNNAGSEDLFDVAGGPILITSFECLVTETIDSNAATCQVIVDRDDGAANTEFSTAVAITSDVLGTLWVFSNANPAVLTPLTPGAVGQSTLMTPWFCPEGMIETVFSAANLDGSINYYMTYRPLVTGVTVTAQ